MAEKLTSFAKRAMNIKATAKRTNANKIKKKNIKVVKSSESAPDLFELYKWIQWGHTHKVLAALDKYPSPSIPVNSPFEGMTLLHEACRRANMKVVEALIKYGASIEIKDATTGKSPIHYAAGVGDKDILYLLLKKGATINVKDLKDQTPAHAAAEGGHLACLKLLKKFLGRLDDSNTFLNKPLHRAVASNHIQVAAYLLENGANIEAENIHSQRPLHCAISQGQLESVKLLVENGANVEVGVASQNDMKPLHLAVKKNFPNLVKYLINEGANINAPDGSLETPLHMAVQNKNVEVMKWLIDSGADLDSRTAISMKTPLHLAAASGFTDGLVLLVSSGANVNATSIEGRTPLHYASFKGNDESVKYLLNNRAKRNIKDINGLTAQQLAQNGTTISWFKERNQIKWPSWLAVDTKITTGGVRRLHDTTPPKELNLFPLRESKTSKVRTPSSPLCLFSKDYTPDNIESALRSSLGRKVLSSAFANEGNNFTLPVSEKKSNPKKKNKRLSKSSLTSSYHTKKAHKENKENKENNKLHSQQMAVFMSLYSLAQDQESDYYKSLLQQDTKMVAAKQHPETPKKWNQFFQNFKSLGSPSIKKTPMFV